MNAALDCNQCGGKAAYHGLRNSCARISQHDKVAAENSRRVRNILKKELLVIVNAAFCGEFVVVKGDEEIFEFKYSKTKNSAIYRDSSMEDWFEENVRGDILTQLEDFGGTESVYR
ncbi:hypothetical protein Trydic_g14168 [Trypoxylus dichotomus]